MEIVPFGGWERNARLVCNDVELIVTLEVGPRVISFGAIGGPNLFVVHQGDAGQTGGDHFRGYGGHRLWIAPEEAKRTMQPDNDPVEYTMDGDAHVFTARPDTYHTQKEIRIRPEPENDRFVLEHRIYNHSPYELELAAWTPTQCVGGEVIFPQAPYETHEQRLLPARPLVLWGYSKMQDPRWTWGDQVVRLRHSSDPEPQKVGALVAQGYAACWQEGGLFLKRFACEEGAVYPDMGCNFETFTRDDMLEIESLAPMEIIAPNAYTEHTEVWYLVRGERPPTDDAECAKWLAALAESRPLA